MTDISSLNLWIAVFSAVATFFAAVATAITAYAGFRGPVNAAKLASKLQDESFRRNVKLNVFATIMQNRTTIADRECVKMLNIIDTVFHESREVREAWSDLHSSFNDQRLFQNPEGSRIREDKLTSLLAAIAKDIGLWPSLSTSDLKRTYYPEYLAKEREIQILQQNAIVNELQASTSQTQLELAAEKR